MKKILLLIFTVLTMGSARAQLYAPIGTDEAALAGGMGVTWINGAPFYTFHFTPEIAFANFGVGLDLNLEISAEGKLRKENFNEFSDYLSIIRYVRYGQKKDPFYARIGALDNAMLGHGSIMYMYNNSPSYDTRKVGLELDADFGYFGLETVYSNFMQAGVVGARAYARPLQFTNLADIPIIGGLEVGASVVNDFDEFSGIRAGSYNRAKKEVNKSDDAGNMRVMGFDLGLPLLRASVVNIDAYFDVNKIAGFGSGSAAGLIFNFNGLGLITADVKVERRFNGDKYIPSYFNSFYEIERFRVADSSLGTIESKAKGLELAKSSSGYFGELGVNVLGAFKIIGSFQRLDENPQSGILHLSTNIAPEGASFVARAGYDKINIIDFKDVLKLDDRSLCYAELGYKPFPYMIVSMLYKWTFEPVRDLNDNVVDYSVQKKLEPRISFVYPFNVAR